MSPRRGARPSPSTRRRGRAGGGGGEGEGEGDFGPPASGRPRAPLPAGLRAFDRAKILVRSGDGGRGAVAFRREKFVPKGGPAGGDGGRGGHVFLTADSNLDGLRAFRGQVHFRAEPGVPGGGSDMHGRAGGNLVVRVPPGTLVRAADAPEGAPPLAELMRPGEQVILLEGGQGGRGNASFKSSLNRAPVIAENGEPGAEKWLELELKVVADAAFVGAPNAGKSSLLAALSNARPKVADYPFTTLVPNLGVCERGARQVVFADVPGLLEGASEGLGLGLEFLRHCERCRALVHVVDGSAPDPVADFWTIRRELESYGRGLPEKRAVVAYTKTDLPDSSDYWGDIREVFEAEGLAAVAVSSATGEGLDELVKEVVGCLESEGGAGVSADAQAYAAEPQFVPGEGERRGAPRSGEADSDEPSASPGAAPPRGEWGLDPGSEVRTAGSAREERRKALKERARRRAPLSSFTIERDGFHQEYTVRGEGLERLAAMTNFAYYESLQRFQRSLKESGAEKALVRAGVQEGNTVFVGDVEFQWSADRGEAALYGAWLEQARAEGTGRQGAARWPKKGTSA